MINLRHNLFMPVCFPSCLPPPTINVLCASCWCRVVRASFCTVSLHTFTKKIWRWTEERQVVSSGDIYYLSGTVFRNFNSNCRYWQPVKTSSIMGLFCKTFLSVIPNASNHRWIQPLFNRAIKCTLKGFLFCFEVFLSLFC